MSYSIYLWQEPFLYAGHSAWWQVPPANIGLTLAAAASYFIIERPCLRSRRRLEQRLLAKLPATVEPRLAPAGVQHR